MTGPTLTYQDFRRVAKAYYSLSEEDCCLISRLRILLVEKLANKYPELAYRLAHFDDVHFKLLRRYFKARHGAYGPHVQRRAKVREASLPVW